MELLASWSSTSDFLPHGFCYQWKPSLLALHTITDVLIAIAYLVISIELMQFVRKRRDLPFKWMFACFGVFILACGMTHVMEVLTLWVPLYWESGVVKLITAAASISTAAFLVRSLPAALKLPSAQDLREANEELERQSVVLRQSEEKFRTMADNIQEIFWMMNPKTAEVTYVSPAFEQICELKREDLYAAPTLYRDLLHPEDRQRVLEELANLEITNRFDEEFRIVCPNGTQKWVRAIGFNSKDSTGAVKTYVGTVQEITARKEMEFALRESEDLFRDLVEHSSDLICTHDLDGRMLSVNELPAKLLGYTKEELLNKPMREFLPPEAREEFDESLKSIGKKGFAKGRMVVLSKRGERRVWEYHNTLRTDGVRGPVVRGVAHDVTDQVRMERALRLSEEKFSKAFLASPYPIIISTIENGKLIEVNDSFLRITGFSREESIGHTSLELGVWADAEEPAAILRQIQTTKHVQSKEVVFRTKGGKRLIVNYSAEVIEIGGHDRLLSVCEDISARKEAENELRRLSGQLLRLQDEERRKIARDLHDSTGQELVALTTSLSQLYQMIPAVHRKWRKIAEQCHAVSDRTLREVRTLSYLLHPPLLDEAGLEDAIYDFADGFKRRTGINVEIEVSPNIGRFSEDKELAIFRVVQESLINIQRHSGSSTATINLTRTPDRLNLSVIDAGKGIPPRARASNGKAHFLAGVGLPSMAERIRQVGGKLMVESSAKGTRIHAEVPACG